ncbi:dicarboxylate/amino acid:cation symporter [Candidatus Berkiella cookevillensis]|uniref:Dicarboxylate/amino acid:cation symporter n=1 Tax=Candidatus Berkiella cookevillensis TaxID=437022 RepID=A0A0Q9YCJ1_9GAMM|nr:dicarboxylate/amino acid:cation symporter [Candidatus Berkiella cookevillensis]MCS5708098.1 dicarboxylate/amino acid:cation symporter [Candidatus Berkiella cookevillensis]
MCIQTHPKQKKKFNTALVYLFIILLAVVCGLSDFKPIHDISFVISDTFIKIFKCISLPIIALSIIVTLSQYSADNGMRKIWQKSLFYTISTTIVAASVAFLLYLWISPKNIATTTETNTATQVVQQGSYFEYLSQLIPNNIFSPFLEHQVMAALFLSIVVGIAIRYIPDNESRRAIANFFKGAHGLFLVVTGWVVKIIPIALFGFISTTVFQLKNGVDIKGLAGYLSVVVLANIVQGFVILPLFLYMNRIRPFVTMKAMLPALSVAFFSKSSTGTLPVTMETAERNLNISPKVSRFVLPLCTSINMNGCAAFIFTTVIFLMQNNGADISLLTMMLWIIIATIAAIGNAGVPMGCFFLSASLLTSMNVPITLLGLILPFYSIIDMIETALNVWSDSCVATVIDKHDKADTVYQEEVVA